jgi:hypothetical protein
VSNGPRYRLELEAGPSAIPADVRLASLLKVAGRRFGFKCVGLVEDPPAEIGGQNPPVSAASMEGNAMNGTDASAFIGWLRPNGRSWFAAVEAESEAEAWRLLLAHHEHGDKCVLGRGRHPNDRPANSPPGRYRD